MAKFLKALLNPFLAGKEGSPKKEEAEIALKLDEDLDGWEEEPEEPEGSWDDVEEEEEDTPHDKEMKALDDEIARMVELEKAVNQANTPCPNCKAGNTKDAKFCNQCGSNMKVGLFIFFCYGPAFWRLIIS